MSIGTISSPTTWVVGTVATPTWFQGAQDNINGLINGTGPTLKALQIDGTGGASSSQASGTVGISTTIGGTSVATSVPVAGALYKDMLPFAMCRTAGSGTFKWGINIASVSRSGQGIYVVTIGSAMADRTHAIALASPNEAAIYFATCSLPTSTTIGVSIYDAAGAAQDDGFGLVVFGGLA